MTSVVKKTAATDMRFVRVQIVKRLGLGMGNGNRVPGDDIIISQATHHIAGWAKHIAGWATPQLLLHLQMAGPIPQPAGPVIEPAGPVIQLAGPVIEPAGPVIQPAGPVIQRPGPVIQTTGPVI